MLWRKHSNKTNDEQIVERSRNNLRQVKRWGHWWKAFHWTMAIVYVAIIVVLCKVLMAWGNNLAQNQAELWFGFVLGLFGGANLHRMAQGVFEGTLNKMADERDRLLVMYHDALLEEGINPVALRDMQLPSDG